MESINHYTNMVRMVINCMIEGLTHDWTISLWKWNEQLKHKVFVDQFVRVEM